MSDGFEMDVEDLGLDKLIKRANLNIHIDAGLLPESDRSQFRLGDTQGVKKSTADLLLSAVSGEDLAEEITGALKKAVFDGADPEVLLNPIAERLKEKMGSLTDDPQWGGGSKTPRPQLKNALMVKIKNEG